MSDKIDTSLLNVLVKALDTEIALITPKMDNDERVIAWSKIQGMLLTISSEAMGLVSDTAAIIGTTTNAQTSATENLINDLLSTIDEKGHKGEN